MDELKMVKDYPDHIPDPTEQEIDALRRRVADATTDAGRGRGRSWWRLPRGFLIPAAAAMLTGVLVLSIGLIRGNPTEQRPPEPAEPGAPSSQILADAAAKLDNAEAAVVVPRPDKWRYQQTSRMDQELGTIVHEEWHRADYEQHAFYEEGQLQIRGRVGAELDYFADLVELYEYFASLPEDTTAILDRVYGFVDEYNMLPLLLICSERAACDNAYKEPWNRDAGAYYVISEMLTFGVPPAEVQAKLFRAMREIRGVQDVGRVDDTTGEEVLAVAWRPPFANRPDIEIEGLRYIAIDPDTSLFRGTLAFATDAEPSEKALSSHLILNSGFVDQPGERP